ncbi:hypothetical protein QM259_19725, partial [Acinetobacter baumannii]|nr:hypothetical protein [Acinetobacter baumannii]
LMRKAILLSITILILGLGVNGQTVKPSPTPVAPEAKDASPLLLAAKIGTAEQLVILCSLLPTDEKFTGQDPARDLTN